MCTKRRHERSETNESNFGEMKSREKEKLRDVIALQPCKTRSNSKASRNNSIEIALLYFAFVVGLFANMHAYTQVACTFMT